MNLSNLSIEITRRCNLKCKHCLRGTAEDNDINLNLMNNILSYIENIYMLTITGGEPLLNINGIKKLYNIIKSKKIIINNFYLTSNFLFQNSSHFDDFNEIILKLYDYCTENYYTQVEYSDDQFHNIKPNETYIKKMRSLPFFSYRSGFIDICDLYRSGRCKFGNILQRENEIIFKNGYINGDIYINVIGKIINGSNWSYAEQPSHEITIKDLLEIIKKE